MRIVSLLILLLSSISSADYVEVQRSALVRTEASSQSEVVLRLESGEKYELLNEGNQTKGYYLISLADSGNQGWVYRSRVRRFSGPMTLATAPSANIGFDGTDCDQHLIYGTPKKSDQIMCRRGYAIGYNYTTKTPDWVSYRITRASVHGMNVDRSGSFKVDKGVPAEFRSRNSNYLKTGYDKGHMAPSAAIDFSRAANDETFLLSNMAPQKPGFNRNMMGRTGVWGEIEDRVRGWIKNRDPLFVFAGTHFSGNVEELKGGVKVPTHFYKIIYDPITTESIAFWMPQDEDTGHKIVEYLVSIDDVELVTGHDLLSAIDDVVEQVIESTVQDDADWAVN